MSVILNKLIELGDDEYKVFMKKITPNVDESLFLGVRNPKVEAYAKELVKNNEYKEFINDLPHKYFDEYMLHGKILTHLNDYNEIVDNLNKFLPNVDNWAVCDSCKPKEFKKKKNKERLLKDINIWINDSYTYTQRFGIEMLMNLYLDDDFDPKYIDIVASVKPGDYYLNMMIAWYFATALTKQWDYALPYIVDAKLDNWINNKAIQKARESLVITKEQKEYLNQFKRK